MNAIDDAVQCQETTEILQYRRAQRRSGWRQDVRPARDVHLHLQGTSVGLRADRRRRMTSLQHTGCDLVGQERTVPAGLFTVDTRFGTRVEKQMCAGLQSR